MGLPVVKPDWVYEAWRRKSVPTIEEFTLPYFTGCLISITEVEPGKPIFSPILIFSEERAKLVRAITMYGGEYEKDLHRKCTHLVTPVPLIGLTHQFRLPKAKNIKEQYVGINS